MSRPGKCIVPRAVVESLEARSLLSEISVQSFGARPNDGGDDTSAIQAAVNGSQPGDTIVFPGGTYNLSGTVRVKGGRTYAARDGATLVGDPAKHIFYVREDNTRIENFTFDGKPIMIDKPFNSMVVGAVINNNLFRVRATGSDAHGITFTTGLRESAITSNRFENAPHGIYGYYWDKLTIANNEFINNAQGIHIDDHSNSSRDLLVEQNYFAGIRRMAIEYQGGGHNSVFQDNWYEKPALKGDFSANNETFAYSIIADRSVGTVARRNVVIAPERPDGVGVRIAFEIGGDNALVEDNYISGVNHVLAANDGTGTTSVTARNNFYENVLQGPVGRNLTQFNNGPHVRVSWDVNRGRPQRNLRFGQSIVEATPPAPAPQPEPAPAPAPEPSPVPTVRPFVYLTDLLWKSTRNSWGPAERDRTNGNDESADSGALRLDGKIYRRGIGVAANSEVVYNLNGRFRRFHSDIGIDDRAGDEGSVTFQVWADGKKIFDSGVMTGEDKKRGVTLRVAGVKTLKLVTRDAGDGEKSDHANWAAARLVPAVESLV